MAVVAAAAAPAAAAPKPVTLCGLTVTTVADVSARLSADPSWRPVSAGPTYRAWQKGAAIWALSTPANIAHPVAVCKDPYKTAAGNWQLGGGVICEASAKVCAGVRAAFAEQQKHMAAGTYPL